MAANLGERALAEVQQEGLDEFLLELADLYPDHIYDSYTLGVPVLDALLEVFASKKSQHRDQGTSGQDQLRDYQAAAYDALLQGADENEDVYELDETCTQDDIDPVDPLFSDPDENQKRPIPILEISSSLSSSGKSQLLYYIIAIAILPRKYGEIAVGGQDAAVVFIDTDDRFDAQRLRVVARGIIQQRKAICGSLEEQSNAGEIESLLVSCLQHVHVLRPQSSTALLATLRSLDSYLLDLSRHRSASRPLRKIAIDSVTAFIWPDRLREDVARLKEIGRPREDVERENEQKQVFHLSDLYDELAGELKRLQTRFHCAIVYTSVISGGRAAPDNEFQTRASSLRPALPAPWGTLPTLRLIVHRSAVRPFPPGMAPRMVVQDARSRQTVVRQGKISAWVNTWGRDGWPRQVVEAIEAINGGAFSFFVRDTGVEIASPDE